MIMDAPSSHLFVVCFITLGILYIGERCRERRELRKWYPPNSKVHGRGTPPPDADKRQPLNDWIKR